ncbi:ABC transporter substrate-binding protein [Acrocarpospora sp. B8E8]|uniref:ABC transporter substrate-binding protein n=1 Tax=Acrocarpospora sp. B8E8 TaxID=3153572 RepID=UPI00325E6B8B
MLKKLSAALAVGLLASVLAACGGGGEDTASGGEAGSGKIVLGFSQVGSESGWRAANTKSVKDSAATAGIDLKFSDAQQKQENQIASIRSYIQQKVDVIAFSPVVVTGWDAVLKEAQAAKIPVILTDRAVDSDASLYATFIGSDFVKEGEEVGKWALEEFKSATGPVNIVQLEGTVGSAPAIDRKKGFEATIASNPNLKVIASQSGDFTRAKGKEVMQALLQANPKIDLLFAHNDDMGLGAIEAIKAAGLKPGTDIKIATIDAVKDGMTALAANEINFIAECSPLLGEQLMELTKKAAAGEPLEKRIVTKETTFTPQQAAEVLSTRQY